MRLTELFTDDDAVSPVIGVILMVAITVILAAVIGAFVLGFGGGGPSAPSVSWESSDDSSGNVTFTHDGGDSIEDPTTVLVPGGAANTDSFSSNSISGSEMTTGDSLTQASTDIGSGDEVLLIWESPDGDSTQELASHSI